MVKLPPSADHVLISENPKAGSGARRHHVQQLTDLLVAGGLLVEHVTDLGRVSQRAAELLAGGRLRSVVGAGGDGTMLSLLNCVPAGTPLAMLPLGTENLLSKFHRQRRGAPALAKMLSDGYVTRYDAGRANGRLFLLMASAGFDAEVARRVDESRGGSITHLNYVGPIWAAIRHYEYPQMRVSCETPEGQRQLEARFCFIFNLPRYGLGLRFTPEADGTDGLLNVCLFRGGSFLNGLRYLAAVALGRHRKLKDCTVLQARHLKIDSSGRVPYQLDGDPGGVLPLELNVEPQRATLIVPEPSR